MSIETLKNALPEYAKDLKLNLGSVAAEAALTDQQRWGALVATAIASRNTAVIQAVEAEAQTKLSPEALAAYMKREYETWGRVVKQANIKAE